MSGESPATVNFKANAVKYFVFCKEFGSNISKQLVHVFVCFYARIQQIRMSLFAYRRRELLRQ
jgi:hypothetical protein